VGFNRSLKWYEIGVIGIQIFKIGVIQWPQHSRRWRYGTEVNRGEVTAQP